MLQGGQVSECNEVVAMLSEYLDRDLPPETCSTIQRHLMSCPNCGAAEASLRRTVDLCRNFRMESRPGPLPPDKHGEMKAAFQRVLEQMRERRNS